MAGQVAPMIHRYLLSLVLSVLPALAFAGDDVVLRVGTVRVTVAAAQARLSKLDAVQLTQYGASASEIRAGFVERDLVPALLFEQEALVRASERSLLWLEMLRGRVLVRSLQRALEAEYVPTERDVLAYYMAHQTEFIEPPALLLWRIRVERPEQAEHVLEELAKSEHPERTWARLAREESLDRATHLRSGSLGYVRPSGHCDTPQLRVDASLYAAALGVSDGQWLSRPVPDGSHLAVLWRRATRPGRVTSLQDERASIEGALRRRHLQDTVASLTSDLRRQSLTQFQPDLIELLEYARPARVGPPGEVADVHPAAGNPAPQAGLRGDR